MSRKSVSSKEHKSGSPALPHPILAVSSEPHMHLIHVYKFTISDFCSITIRSSNHRFFYQGHTFCEKNSGRLRLDTLPPRDLISLSGDLFSSQIMPHFFVILLVAIARYSSVYTLRSELSLSLGVTPMSSLRTRTLMANRSHGSIQIVVTSSMMLPLFS
jgi:hypothetical protein